MFICNEVINYFTGCDIYSSEWRTEIIYSGESFDSITVSSTEIRNSLDTDTLKSKFNNIKSVNVNSLEGAIESFNQQSHISDMLAIIGSHYIGPVISNIYKINFDNL